jgi:hypothetical protein
MIADRSRASTLMLVASTDAHGHATRFDDAGPRSILRYGWSAP